MKTLSSSRCTRFRISNAHSTTVPFPELTRRPVLQDNEPGQVTVGGQGGGKHGRAKSERESGGRVKQSLKDGIRKVKDAVRAGIDLAEVVFPLHCDQSARMRRQVT